MTLLTVAAVIGFGIGRLLFPFNNEIALGIGMSAGLLIGCKFLLDYEFARRYPK